MTTTHCQAMHIQSDRQVMHITKEYGKSRQSPACVTKLHHIYLSTNLSDMHQASNKALRTFQGHIATDINNTLRMDRLSLLSKDNNSELLWASLSSPIQLQSSAVISMWSMQEPTRVIIGDRGAPFQSSLQVLWWFTFILILSPSELLRALWSGVVPYKRISTHKYKVLFPSFDSSVILASFGQWLREVCLFVHSLYIVLSQCSGHSLPNT